MRITPNGWLAGDRIENKQHDVAEECLRNWLGGKQKLDKTRF